MRTPDGRRGDAETRNDPRMVVHPASGGGRHRGFPWSWPLQQEIVLRATSPFPINRDVATLARDTQLELLHYVIETQRLVNALPAAAADRAMDVVLDRVQTVTNADGAAVELVEGNVMVNRAVSGLSTDRQGTRIAGDNTLSGLCVRVGHAAPLPGHRNRPAGGRRHLPSDGSPLHRGRADGQGRGTPRRAARHVERSGALRRCRRRGPRVDGQSHGFGTVQHLEARSGSRACPPGPADRARQSLHLHGSPGAPRLRGPPLWQAVRAVSHRP